MFNEPQSYRGKKNTVQDIDLSQNSLPLLGKSSFPKKGNGEIPHFLSKYSFLFKNDFFSFAIGILTYNVSVVGSSLFVEFLGLIYHLL